MLKLHLVSLIFGSMLGIQQEESPDEIKEAPKSGDGEGQ